MTLATNHSSSRVRADHTLRLTVTSITESARGIRTFTLANGAPLPGFVAGSHVMVAAGEHVNAYSLVSDGTHPTEYAISVLRVPDGAGGSRWLHDHVTPGDSLHVGLPRNGFAPLAHASKHLLIAGGIGVTPIVSHLRSHRRWGRKTQVIYTFRPGRGAHIDDILDLTGGDAELFTARTDFLSRLHAALRQQPIGTHLYVCGPGALIDDAVAAAADAGWPKSRIHLERFGIDNLDAGDPFAVRLTHTGATVPVPAGVSMLEAIEAAGVVVPNLCRQGVCGECRIPVSAGIPVHRDLYLSAEEKVAGGAVMACVSRAARGCTLEVPL